MLSIIIPVYNVEKYLRQCLDSVYKLNIEKEIILVNDGSTDASLEIIMEYKNKYFDITEIINQENQGLSVARNNGLLRANGEYIYFLDSDDWIDDKEFLNSYNILINNNDLDMVISKNVIYMEDTKREFCNYNLGKEITKKIYSGKEYFILSIKNRIFNPVIAIYIYRKKFLIENNFLFPKNRTHEDEIFTLRVLKNANNIKCTNNKIYYYRQRENSIMRTIDIKHPKSMFKNVKELIEEFENEENNEFKRVVFYKIKRYYKSALKYSFRNNYVDLYDEILKEFKKDCDNYFFKIKHYKFDIVEIYFIYKFHKLYYKMKKRRYKGAKN